MVALGGAWRRAFRTDRRFHLCDAAGRRARTADPVQPCAPCRLDGDRLPLLPHVGREFRLRRDAAHQDLHELPLADLDQQLRRWNRCARASEPTNRSSGPRSTTFPISSISITAFMSRRASAARPATGASITMALTYQQAVAADALVPRLPSQSGEISSAARSDHDMGYEPSEPQEVTRRAAGEGIPRSEAGDLLDMSQIESDELKTAILLNLTIHPRRKLDAGQGRRLLAQSR